MESNFDRAIPRSAQTNEQSVNTSSKSNLYYLWHDIQLKEESSKKGMDPKNYMRKAKLKMLAGISSFDEFMEKWKVFMETADLKLDQNLYLFKDGIKPLWEDPSNLDGGKWVVLDKGRPGPNGIAEWLMISAAVLRGNLGYSDDIIGACFSVREWGCMWAVWNRDSTSRTEIEDVATRIQGSFGEQNPPEVLYQPHRLFLQKIKSKKRKMQEKRRRRRSSEKTRDQVGSPTSSDHESSDFSLTETEDETAIWNVYYPSSQEDPTSSSQDESSAHPGQSQHHFGVLPKRAHHRMQASPIPPPTSYSQSIHTSPQSIHHNIVGSTSPMPISSAVPISQNKRPASTQPYQTPHQIQQHQQQQSQQQPFVSSTSPRHPSYLSTSPRYTPPSQYPRGTAVVDQSPVVSPGTSPVHTSAHKLSTRHFPPPSPSHTSVNLPSTTPPTSSSFPIPQQQQQQQQSSSHSSQLLPPASPVQRSALVVSDPIKSSSRATNAPTPTANSTTPTPQQTQQQQQQTSNIQPEVPTDAIKENEQLPIPRAPTREGSSEFVTSVLAGNSSTNSSNSSLVSGSTTNSSNSVPTSNSSTNTNMTGTTNSRTTPKTKRSESSSNNSRPEKSEPSSPPSEEHDTEISSTNSTSSSSTSSSSQSAVSPPTTTHPSLHHHNHSNNSNSNQNAHAIAHEKEKEHSTTSGLRERQTNNTQSKKSASSSSSSSSSSEKETQTHQPQTQTQTSSKTHKQTGQSGATQTTQDTANTIVTNEQKAYFVTALVWIVTILFAWWSYSS